MIGVSKAAAHRPASPGLLYGSPGSSIMTSPQLHRLHATLQHLRYHDCRSCRKYRPSRKPSLVISWLTSNSSRAPKSSPFSSHLQNSPPSKLSPVNRSPTTPRSSRQYKLQTPPLGRRNSPQAHQSTSPPSVQLAHKPAESRLNAPLTMI
jgi:hypothetical protein